MTQLFGLETEYGLAAQENSDPEGDGHHAARNFSAARALVDAVRVILPGLPDRSPCGTFLANGSRVYLDNDHPESATPEVSTPWDLVRYTLAGERVLERALARCRDADGAARPLLFKSNVDYLTHHSWGCHESILCTSRTFDAPQLLIPHLVSRVVFTGAGGFDPECPGITFVLSPRALFLEAPVSFSSTGDRGIVHDKDEPLGAGPYRRLHLICGESLCSERGMWLKAATTVLTVRMIDEGLDGDEAITLVDPVASLRSIVQDPSCCAEVHLADGRRMTALDLQRHYLRAAEARIGAAWMPDWTRTACEHWRAMLDQLEHAPESVATTLDWGIKRALFGRVLARHGFDWALVARWTAALVEVMKRFAPGQEVLIQPDPERLLDPGLDAPSAAARIQAILNAHGFDRGGLASFLRARRALFECDIRFGQLGGEGIFQALDRDGVLTHHVPGVDDIERAMEQPPAQGRARVRGEAIRRLAGDARHFTCDWTSICARDSEAFLDLADPFEEEERWRRTTELPSVETGQVIPPRHLDWGPYTLRSRALEDFLAGRYDAAEEALGTLLSQGFEIQSTHCHLARLFLAQGREDRARQHTVLSWDARDTAPRYVVARAAWLQTLFAVIDGRERQPWIDALKALTLEREQLQSWSMTPVLDRLRPRLPHDDFEMMRALFQVVSGEGDRSALDRHAWWSAA